jgi:hypothetical protein
MEYNNYLVGLNGIYWDLIGFNGIYLLFSGIEWNLNADIMGE